MKLLENKSNYNATFVKKNHYEPIDSLMKRKKIKSNNRTHQLTCMLTDEELKAINCYLKHYNITNKSNWVRHTLIKSIISHQEMDYPTLFDEFEMR